jgi:gluconolactonase
VFDKGGRQLGIIPVPRRAITVAFSGPGKQTLYVGAMGAVGPDGKAWTTPEGVRNVAMTIYRAQTLAAGYKGRPK